MARTKKGAKGPGYDYWGKRPMAGKGFGKDIKKITLGKERAARKALEKKAKKERE
jgi:hypothetical protein